MFPHMHVKRQCKTENVNDDDDDDNDHDADDNDDDKRLCIAVMFYIRVGCRSESGYLDSVFS
jgi:hypothetical protein